MTLKGTTGTTNGRSEDGYKDLTVDAKKQRAREKKNEWQRANRKRKLDGEAARDAAGAAGDAADELEKEAGEKKSKRESLAVDPVVSPPALRSPSPADTLLDRASLDDEVTLRYDGSPERTARSPQSGDGDEDWSDVLDDEQPTQRCSPERTARSPSPEAVRSPSWVSSTPLRGTPRNSATFFRRGWSPCRSGSPPPRSTRL